MKKIIVLVLLVVLLGASCELRDGDGFRLFEFGWSVAPNHALIQSHDGYVVDGAIQYEVYHKIPVTIENVLDKTIKVKVTYAQQSAEWITVAPLAILELKEEGME